MSLRFNATDSNIIRTTSLPTSATSYTIVVFAKLLVAHPTYWQTIALLASAGTAQAQLAVLDNADSGLNLIGADNYGATRTATVSTLTAGGASGTNWFGVALRGSASGANGLSIYHRPVGAGSTSVQRTNNANLSGGAPANLLFGDLPAGGGSVDDFWFDGHIAHVKVWNAALSDAEIDAELQAGPPVRTSGLLSYNSFVGNDLAAALIPSQGSGTFTTPGATPVMSTDDPVLAVPGARVSWIEFDVPFAFVEANPNGVTTRAAVGQPTVDAPGPASTVYASWVELEIPPPAAATTPTGVASRAAIGLPNVSVDAKPIGVASRAAVGQPSTNDGQFTGAGSVASVAAVGTPAVSAQGEINGTANLVIDQAVTASPFGVQTRRAVGTPSTTYVGTMSPSSVASRAVVSAPTVSGGAQINLASYGVISRAAVGTPTLTLTVPSADARPAGVSSRAAIGQPMVENPITTQTVYAEGRPPLRAVGQPGVTALSETGQVLVNVQQGGGGPDGDDDDTVGPHKVPRGRRPKKTEDEVKQAARKAEEADRPEVATKPITPEAAPYPRPVEGGVLVTPAMLQQIKDDAMRAARMAVEARQLKEGKLVTAARSFAQQKAQQRLERLADLAIEAAEEAEYEPTEREQVKQIEIEDPVTGKPIRATIKSKVAA